MTVMLINILICIILFIFMRYKNISSYLFLGVKNFFIDGVQVLKGDVCLYTYHTNEIIVRGCGDVQDSYIKNIVALGYLKSFRNTFSNVEVNGNVNFYKTKITENALLIGRGILKECQLHDIEVIGGGFVFYKCVIDQDIKCAGNNGKICFYNSIIKGNIVCNDNIYVENLIGDFEENENGSYNLQNN